MLKMNILGIDIGTTTITALVLNTENNAIEKSKTLPNGSFITGRGFERLQDPEIIISTVQNAVKAVTENLEIHAIGVTGQMHGILYLDSESKPCSPLMIWQDERGNEHYRDSKTYAEYLTEKTGLKAATGFGLTTHFYNTVNGEIPENARKISTIHDYLVTLLTGCEPLTHSSDGASLGFWNLAENTFDEKALKSVGIDTSYLPKVIKSTSLAGKTSCDFLPQGIPVSVAIGDNQGSFLGSVKNRFSSVLCNVGTGSQVSFVTKKTTVPKAGEIRPLTDDEYIFVGSSLCGGRAYATLKSFFSNCAEIFGAKSENLFALMDSLAEKGDGSLLVNCEFCGTRENPLSRGSIENISTENFTPENLTLGVLKGVCTELKAMFDGANELLDFTPEALILSGNGLRKSKIWREIFKDGFSLNSQIPKHSEEACVGACVFGAAAAGIFKNINDAQEALLR